MLEIHYNNYKFVKISVTWFSHFILYSL